ncbi:MAG: hypothetical protein ACRDYB_10240, partial [Acidimicrobiales bacterium]
MIVGPGDPYLYTSHFWLSSYGPSLAQLNAQEDYFTNSPGGYSIVSWQYATDGCQTKFSQARALGYDASPQIPSADKWTNSRPDEVCTSVTGVARTPDSAGYWQSNPNGGVFNFGDAAFDGSLATTGDIPNAPIVGVAPTPDGGGYWLVGSDGGIYTFGNAGFYGSEGGKPLNAPVVDMADTSDGGGYWLVAADGGIFTFGNATYY